MSVKFKVDDRVAKRLVKRISRLSKKGLEVGVLASKGGNKEYRNGSTVLEVAAVHEFGSPENGIPRRSFIQSTLESASVKREQARLSSRVAAQIIAKHTTVEKGLAFLGEWAKNKITDRIAGDEIRPALKPATAKRKGFDNVLVETGKLVDSIDYEVK